MTNAFEPARNVTPFKRETPLPPVGNLATKVLTTRVFAQLHNISIAAAAADRWPAPMAELVTRAASAPAMTTVAGWAAELAIRQTADTLEALGPASAGAQILQAGLVLTFNGAGSISAPGFVADFGNAGWVAEGQPIPVRQATLNNAVLNPHKLAAIAVLTREMIESSNAEALITDALVRAAGRALDEVLFDANPADAARPAGLRNGIAALTASNNTTGSEAFFEDVAALINAVAPVAGNERIVLVASPGRARQIGLRMNRVEDPKLVVVGSSAVVNDLLAVAPVALVAALNPEPDVEASEGGTLHMDTAPTAVGSAAPHRSLFQTDSIGIKVRWPATWALRDPRGFAWLVPVWK